jgi:hypothetical protein
MSTTTTNYKLFKPELSDPADITKMNPNWDTIDAELYKKATLDNDGKVLRSQIPNAESFEVVVPTAGWTDDENMKRVSVFVSGVTEDFEPIYGLKPIGKYATEGEEEAFSFIKGLVTSNGEVTLYASEVPTTSITLMLKGA